MPHKGHKGNPEPPGLKGYLEKLNLVQSIREFLGERGFLEVITPPLTRGKDPSPNIENFETTCGLNLITSPEFEMKKLLHMGFERIFQICYFFRKNELLERHNPLFLGVEWYEVEKDYGDTAFLFEELVSHVAERLFGRTLKKPFRRITVKELFREKGFSEDDLFQRNSFIKKAQSFTHLNTFGDMEFLFNQVFSEIEKELIEPTFVFDFPDYIPSLAKRKGRFRERFEFFMNGIEVANAYTEITWSRENWEILRKAQKERVKRGKIGGIDHELVKIDLPPSTGIAFGVERLLMALKGIKAIEPFLLPFERSIFKKDLRYLLCSRLCYYYNPFKEEKGCGSFRFFQERKDLWDTLVRYGEGDIGKIDRDIDTKVFNIICKTCPYLVGGCDFREDGSSIPCGGYKIVYKLVKYEADTL